MLESRRVALTDVLFSYLLVKGTVKACISRSHMETNQPMNGSREARTSNPRQTGEQQPAKRVKVFAARNSGKGIKQRLLP
ncbi:hypothetical protein B1748_21965 [Paenibacillus sp. MY03]|nr:hypothetical protein B1748_21965 [Paenibacillus sp. MY03]